MRNGSDRDLRSPGPRWAQGEQVAPNMASPNPSHADRQPSHTTHSIIASKSVAPRGWATVHSSAQLGVMIQPPRQPSKFEQSGLATQVALTVEQTASDIVQLKQFMHSLYPGA